MGARSSLPCLFFSGFSWPLVVSSLMPIHDAGQLILVGVPGPELDSESARLFQKIQPGGFILFGRNIQAPAQLRKLIDDLRDLSDIEPVITERLREIRIAAIERMVMGRRFGRAFLQTLGGADIIIP